jgi:predicted nuclease of predicted toxin-antitoxin system
MRQKLDENLGAPWADFLGGFGYDVHTVPQEGLSGTSDAALFETCIREQRCLISLDLDFADVLRFPPERTAGIAVLRMQHGNPGHVLRILNDAFDRRFAEGSHRGAALDCRGESDSDPRIARR